MADIFLSYARADRPRAESLAVALGERAGSVWWDRRIGGGRTWRKEIKKALAEARCVVVLWSEASVESHWVLDEAEEARKRDVILPVRLEDVEIPLGFRQVHAIDLVDWAGDPQHGGFDQLAAEIVRILGRPPPALPARGIGRSQAFTRWGLRALAVMPLAIAGFLYVTPQGKTGIDLDARVSEFSVLLPRQQEVSGLMVVSALEASGLKAIHLPRTRSRPEQTLVGADGRGLSVRLSSAGEPQGAGMITLAPITLSGGTDVAMRLIAAPHQYQLSFTGSALTMQVNAHGRVDVLLPGGEASVIDFGAPKPIALHPDPGGADLALTPVEGQANLLPAPLAVSKLSLFRIDERVEVQRTVVDKVSTVMSGTVRLDSLSGQERVLRSGDAIQFGASQGELQAVQLAGDGLALRFRGTVQRMAICSRDACQSWMPSHFSELRARHPLPVLGLAVAYALVLIVVGQRWWKVR